MKGTLRRTLVAAILACTVSLAGCGNDQELTFKTVEQSSTSASVTQGVHIIRSETEWSAFWDSIKANQSSPPNLPAVDFSSNAVIAVVDAVRPTSGYSITVTRIVGNADGYKIEADQQSPGPSCLVTLISEQPYHIVTAKAFSGNASLTTTPTVKDCATP